MAEVVLKNINKVYDNKVQAVFDFRIRQQMLICTDTLQ